MNIQKYIIDHTKEYTETVKAIIECESELIKDPINHGKELYEFAKKEWEDATEFYNEAIRPIPSYLNIIKKYGKIRIIDIPRNTRDTQNYELIPIILDEVSKASKNSKWISDTSKILTNKEIIKIVEKYEDEAAKSVIKGLGNDSIRYYIEKHNTDESSRTKVNQTLSEIAEIMATPEIAETINKYKGDNSWNIAKNLSRTIEHINTEYPNPDDELDIVKYFIETVKNYKDEPAVAMSDLFMRLVLDNHDIDNIKIFSEIMRTEELIDCCNYNNYLEQLNDQHHGNAILEPLSRLAINTKNKETIKQAAEFIELYKKIDPSLTANITRKIPFDNHYTGNLANLLTPISNIYHKDSKTFEIISRNISDIMDIFGDKTGDYLKYIAKTKSRGSIKTITSIKNTKYVAEQIKKTTLRSHGKKQVKKLISLAAYLDVNRELELNPDIPQDLNDALESARNTLEEYMHTQNITDLDEGIKFIPWIKTKDETALKALSGEKIEKKGFAKTYHLTSKNNIPLKDLRNDIKSYAEMLKLDIEIKEDTEDLEYIKNIARQIMQETDRRKDIDEDILGEIKPNISRILNITHNGNKNYVLCIDPSDIESQMEALQNIGSCLSPNGSMFGCTQEYMKNPNIFWSTIREDDEDGNIVGRATVFIETPIIKHTKRLRKIINQIRGSENTENKTRITRASKVYSHIPIGETEVDELLKTYAEETNLEFIENGTMFVEDLHWIYDDFVSGNKGKVKIRRKT
ncbi:MAG: hypothetical protein KAJ91_03385 [Candidatus Aenigmarchaeota archaeon]|nr:hypothetical protein [Candidatus Aenigmarchaeota archaeon]